MRGSPRLDNRWTHAGRLIIAAPALSVVTTFFLVPFGRSFLHSFMKNGLLGFENYALAVRLYISDIGLTLLVSAAGLAIALVVGVAAGGYVRVHGGRAVEFLFKVPLFVPFVVVGHAMRVFLAPRGLLNSAPTLGRGSAPPSPGRISPSPCCSSWEPSVRCGRAVSRPLAATAPDGRARCGTFSCRCRGNRFRWRPCSSSHPCSAPSRSRS